MIKIILIILIRIPLLCRFLRTDVKNTRSDFLYSLHVLKFIFLFVAFRKCAKYNGSLNAVFI